MLKKSNSIPANVDVLHICDDLENYMHGVFLFESVLRETPDELLMKQVRRFVTHYAKGFKC
ncbi:hypothetical protein D3C87_2039550 [compost metagenome]